MPLVVIEGLALLAQLPLLSALARRPERRDGPFWWSAAIAGVAAGAVVTALIAEGWQSGFVATLWSTLAVTLFSYLVLAAVSNDAWRLAPLVGMYALPAATMALLFGVAPVTHVQPLLPTAWLVIHVGTALITYALVTLAALAAVAAWLQENALKYKRPTPLTRLLPSLTDCEALSLRLLTLGVGVLACGLLTGATVEYLVHGDLLPFTHKTVLTLAAFVVLAGLLVVQHHTGMRGRRAARAVLGGYLLLVLGYPGVKFVSEVLLSP